MKPSVIAPFTTGQITALVPWDLKLPSFTTSQHFYEYLSLDFYFAEKIEEQ